MRSFVLIIAPVQTDFNFAKKMGIVRELCSASNLSCRPPLTEPAPFDLLEMLETIRNAKLVFADLSHSRPSCYYELGLVEAIGCRPILVAETGSQIFQHSGLSEVAFYNNLRDYERLFREAVSKVIR